MLICFVNTPNFFFFKDDFVPCQGRSGGLLGLSISGKGEPLSSASVPGRIHLCVFNGRDLGQLFVVLCPVYI